MTQQEIEEKTYEINSYIADKFRDIKMLSNSLKNPEDELKTLVTLAKISDYSEEIQRGYNSLHDLMYEIPEEETEESFTDFMYEI